MVCIDIDKNTICWHKIISYGFASFCFECHLILQTQVALFLSLVFLYVQWMQLIYNDNSVSMDFIHVHLKFRSHLFCYDNQICLGFIFGTASTPGVTYWHMIVISKGPLTKSFGDTHYSMCMSWRAASILTRGLSAYIARWLFASWQILLSWCCHQSINQSDSLAMSHHPWPVIINNDKSSMISIIIHHSW